MSQAFTSHFVQANSLHLFPPTDLSVVCVLSAARFFSLFALQPIMWLCHLPAAGEPSPYPFPKWNSDLRLCPPALAPPHPPFFFFSSSVVVPSTAPFSVVASLSVLLVPQTVLLSVALVCGGAFFFRPLLSRPLASRPAMITSSSFPPLKHSPQQTKLPLCAATSYDLAGHELPPRLCQRVFFFVRANVPPFTPPHYKSLLLSVWVPGVKRFSNCSQPALFSTRRLSPPSCFIIGPNSFFDSDLNSHFRHT